MKNIVKIALALVALLLPYSAFAQSGYEIYKTNGEKLLLQYNEVDSIVFRANLAEHMDLISNMSSTKKSISYNINAKENETYSHTYIEGWYYDYLMALSKETDGEDFDPDVVVLNLLADYGHQSTGPQSVTWTAGEINMARHDVVRLVGGKEYYILASHYDPEAANWLGKPFVQKVTLEPAGQSDAKVVTTAEKLTTNALVVSMKPDENVNFFYYGFYTKEQYDENIEINGQKWMEDYVYEYGYTASDMYTDNWSVEPDTEYVLALFGVDNAGDTFFAASEYKTPAVKEEFKVSMTPFERPNESKFAYDCLKIEVDATSLKNANTDVAMEVFMPKSTLEETLAMIGFNMDMLRQAPEYLAYLGATDLPEEEGICFSNYKSFTSYRTDLEPETEYCYLILVQNGEQYVLGEAYATTQAKPTEEVASEEYKGYLGEWIVRGKSTSDYTSEAQYKIRIEEDIVNRSFKVYGWGNSEYVKDLAFTARYDSQSHKIFIDGNQDFGKVTIDGVEYNIKFCGMLMYAGELAPDAHDGVVYEGNRVGTHLSMFPNFINGFEFQSMGFVAEKDGTYYALPGDEYTIFNLLVDRE